MQHDQSPGWRAMARGRRRGSKKIAGATRRGLAGALALVIGGATLSLAGATPATAATVHEITGRWTPGTPTTVAAGDVVTAEWRVNVNDDAAAPANDPVDNVTFQVTIPNGAFSAVPDACLRTGVTPASSISPDGKTLICNLGTQDQGTAHVVQTPIRADGETGDEIDAVATIGDQTADVPPIVIENPFGMDIAWQSPTNNINWGDTYVDIDVQWTLFMHKGSDPGPNSVSYRLDVTNTVNAPIEVGPQQCSAFTTGGATGHPWSGGAHPPHQTAPFVDNCSLSKNADGSFTLTLTGIDYSRLQVPTHDSVGRTLPTNREAVASGSVWFRFMSGANNSMTLTSSAPEYRSASGATSTDDPANNTSNKTWTRGGWSNAWQPNYNGIQVPSWWSNEFRISAGQVVQSTTSADWASPNPSAVFGQCQILDTLHVDFVSAEISHGWGGAPLPGVNLEYYVGGAAIVNPASPSYDPNAFLCDQDPGGWTTAPAPGQAVKAVRATYPFSAMTGNPRSSLNVRHQIKPNTPVGTDVWEWGAAYVNGQWQYPNRSMNPADRTGPLTPGMRYPFIGSARDVLYVIGVSPAVTKSVDRSSIKPGVPATYTLNYSANGTGAIAETVDGFELVDTLPVGMSYVAGSATPAPTVTTNGSGQQVLTWSLDDVPTNANNALTYQAVAAPNVTPGTALTNSVVASVEGESSMPATAQVTVSTNGFTAIGKTTDQWFIANPDGSGDGEGSWTVTLRSQDPLPQAFTDTIDILPYNGDGRGTSYSGSYEVTSVEVPSGATVYYTDADPATLSDDPNADANGSAGSPSDLWSTDEPENPTAIRVVGGTLQPGATFAFKINIATDGAAPGDVWMNRAQGIGEHTELVMRTSEPLTMGTYYSASLKKYVQDANGEWRDANDAADYPKFRLGETVKYRIVVTNTGQGTLRDVLLSDDKQPELGEHLIEELAPGEEEAHEYEITIDESTPLSIVNSACATAPTPDDSEEPPTINCDPAGIEVDGEPQHEKSLVSAEPIGNGQWQVVYGIDVTNVSPFPTSYSLEDTLHFTDQATITSAQVTQAPDGVQLADPAWDGQGNVLIAGNVPLAGDTDEAYEAHYYEVTVVADVPLKLDGAGSGEGDPTRCGPDGDDADRAFNNTSAMTDARGDREDDQACAELPSIDIDKKLVGDPVKDGHDYTTTYDIVVANDGGATGEYVLHDQLRFGEGVTIEKVTASNTQPGDVPVLDTYTGQGQELTDEVNALTGEVELGSEVSHTFRVVVNSTVTDGTAAIGGGKCADDGNGPGGFRNVAVVTHNGLTGEATACAPFGWLAKGDLPKTGSPVGPIVALGAALLVAAGLTALVLARRREENEV